MGWVIVALRIVLLITVVTNSNSQGQGVRRNEQNSLSEAQGTMGAQAIESNMTKNEIFGVRWTFGNAYNYVLAHRNQEYLILMFNANQPFLGDISIKIQQFTTYCSHFAHSTHNLTTVIYECRINQDLRQHSIKESISFQILMEIIAMTGQGAEAHVSNYTSTVLFEGSLKLLPMERGDNFQILTLGNWDVLNINEGSSLLCIQKVLADERVRLGIFTGNFIPNFNKVNYQTILKSIELFTSQMVFIFTPGDFDIAEDGELYDLTFKEPQWESYQNYFSLIQLPNINFTVLAYNSNDIVNSIDDEVDLKKIFEIQMPTKIQSILRNEQFVLAASHHSFQCSIEPQCSRNAAKLSNIRNTLQQIGTDLFISSSNQDYQRTKSLCYNGSIISNAHNIYSINCPVYINEGIAVEVTKSQSLILKSFSEVHSQYRGFGIITIFTQFNQIPKKVVFEQYKADQCTIFDSFIFSSKQQEEPTNAPFTIFGLTIRRWLIVIEFTSLAIIIVIIIFNIVVLKCRRNRTDTSNQGHVQMVEQIVASSQRAPQPMQPLLPLQPPT